MGGGGCPSAASGDADDDYDGDADDGDAGGGDDDGDAYDGGRGEGDDYDGDADDGGMADVAFSHQAEIHKIHGSFKQRMLLRPPMLLLPRGRMSRSRFQDTPFIMLLFIL